MSSVKKNILLNGINTITGILFPVVTFPYAARVLLPEGIGAVNFLNSVVSYIVLLTSLGIPMYAVKEIAKYRDDKAQRDKTTVEIIILSTLLCVFGYVIVWLLSEFVPQIERQSSLFYVLSLTILFTAIGVNWFYQGIEDFKFITIRAIIIRTLSVAALFLFVRDSSDLLIYGFIIVGSTVGNNFINFIHLRKHIGLDSIRFSELNIRKHIRPSFEVFILNLIISLYIQLNSIMLGFMSGDEAVGFFTAGTKISHIGLTVIASLGTVLLPRCSHLIKSGDMKNFRQIINKSLNVTLGLSLPMTVGLMVLALPITMIFCGSEYLESIPVLYLNAPVIVVISLTNIMGIQILYPMDKTRLVILSVSGGAVMNLVLNIFLIPLYGATGAAISTLAAELTVLVIQLAAGMRYYPFGLKDMFNMRYLAGALVMGAAVYLCTLLTESYVWQLITGLFIGILVYAVMLLVMKDPMINEIIQIVNKRTSNGRKRI